MDSPTPVTGQPDPEPTKLRIKHSDLPEMEHAQLGDKVHLHLHGEVKSVSAKNKYSDGETEVQVNKMHQASPDEDGVMPGEGPEPTSEEAQSMPLDKLRKRLPHKSEE